MDKYQLKEKYQRFKQWQEKPFDYKFNSNEIHHCNNCGNDFAGNFCPYCSQRADVGRISWLSVHQGVMDIWGLGTRSLLYTLLQLLLRPGQIISDYISGKRQVSFPPVKMLFVVALVYSAVVFWFIPDVLGFKMEIDDSADVVVKDFMEWTQNHYSWSSLILSMFAIIPTWVMFRNSPLHTRHMLPEGFFIQIFLSVLSIVISFLLIPVYVINYDLQLFLYMIVEMVYYIIVYKQLFGYSLWGTLWRQGFVFLSSTMVLIAVMMGVFGSDLSHIIEKKYGIDPMAIRILLGCLGVAAATLTLGLGWLCDQVATRWTRWRASRHLRLSSRYR